MPETAISELLRPASPCTVVIFGAAGDLTKRKLIPALYNLKANGLLPREFAVVGVTRKPKSHEQFREELSQDIHDFATVRVDEPLWKELRDAPLLPVGRVHRPRDLRAARRRSLDEVAATHRTGGNILFYLAVPPSFFGEIVRRLGEAGLVREEGGAWRRVIIEKPFGHDLDSAHALNARWPRILREEPDLPHRPLPRQGDRAEHHGLPLRQRHLRAHLEPPLHRPRADHGGRDGGGRGPRQLLRQGGRAARHDPEPHVPAPGPGGHGAAQLVRGRRRARREGQGAQGDPAHAARGGAAATRCAASTARAWSTASACPPTAASPRSSPDLAHGDLRRAEAARRELALGRRALLPAHRASAWPGATPRS